MWKVQPLSREVIGIQSLEQVGQCHRSLASKMEILCCSSKAGNLHSCGAAWWFHRIQERGIESTEALLIFPSWLLDLPT